MCTERLDDLMNPFALRSAGSAELERVGTGQGPQKLSGSRHPHGT